jgi:archaemetzincin
MDIFYSQIRNKKIQIIQRALTTTYGNVIDVTIGGELALFNEAYQVERGQYNADLLLRHLLKTKKQDTAIWIIQKDIYCTGMNFIFGLAKYLGGAILSIHRLSSSDLIEKEAIHEVGHVLGLGHCRNHCVMQFSNSLWEAKMKPLYLCENCIRKINQT